MNNSRRFRLRLPAVRERNHILLMVAFSFLMGCLAAPFLLAGAWLWGLVAIAAALFVLLAALGAKVGLALVLCFFALGALRWQAAMQTAQPVPAAYEITGTVFGASRLRADDRITFTLADVSLDGTPAPGRAYCSLHYETAPPELFDGAKLRFSGRVYLPDGKSGEPHMDFRLWMRQNGMSYGIAAYTEPTVENTPETAPVADAAYRVRTAFAASLTRVMGDHARVAMALLFGQRDGLTEEEYSSFQTLGIAHVMSVSGLHVGILGAVLEWVLKRLRVRRGVRLPIVILFLFGYCALTGFSASSVRAAVMLALLMTQRLLLRKTDPLTILSEALFAVLLLRPLHAQSAGFVLSFSAMLGIYVIERPVHKLLDRLWPTVRIRYRGSRRGLPKQIISWFQRSVKGIIAVSVAAQAGVLLPTAVYYHQLPLYGVLINLLIVPMVSVLTPLYLLTLLLSPIPFLGAAAGGLASALTEWLLSLVALLSTLPHAAVRVAAPPAIVCIGVGVASVLLSRHVAGRFGRKALSAFLVLCIAFGGAYFTRPAEVRYIQLAVGQADSALLLDGSTTVLIDAGDDGQAALDYLLKEGRDVDALILTHLHMDHAGGVQALLDAGIAIHQVYLPINAESQQVDPRAAQLVQYLRQQNIPVAALARGDELRYNTVRLRVLWPERGKVRSGHPANDYPLVLAVELGAYTLLNMSDLSGGYEAYAMQQADVLKVAHHGSSQSTSQTFLERVSPRFALVSCQSGSRALPAADTLARIQNSHAALLRTDLCGDITLSLRGDELRITPYKARETD